MCTIMFVAFVLFATLGTTFAGYAGSSSNNVGSGSSYGYGYSGSYSGGGGDNIPIPPIPNFPNFDFGSLLNGYFDSFKKYHEHFINTRRPYAFSITSSTPNANVQAQSSITFVNNNGLQQQAQQAAQGGGYASGFSSYGVPTGAAGGHEGSFTAQRGAFPAQRGAFPTDGGAVASASIGPQGGYQTAAVYPENPNAPNIFSRFAETSQGGGGGGGGSYGVFTSSVSSSSNLNGKPQSFHQASTTINDNGKVSTYTVKNP